MNLVERYLRQIERYLPFKDRKDTIKELESLILDQIDELTLSGTKKEDAVIEVLQNMGEPRIVASNYSRNRNIISKDMEPILELVLKIVSITLPLVVLFAQLIEFLFSTPSYTFMDVILEIIYNIPSALYSLFVAIGMIFIFFYLVERFIQPNFTIEDRPFDPNFLPTIPEKAYKVSIFGVIVEILVTVGVVYLFNLNQGLISIYFDGNKIPLLNENFDHLLLFLNIGWFASIVINIYHGLRRRKNLTSKTLESIKQIYGAIVLIMLVTGNIFNDVVINEYNLDVVPTILKIAGIFIGIAIIIGTIVDYVKLFVNLEHLESLEKKPD